MRFSDTAHPYSEVTARVQADTISYQASGFSQQIAQSIRLFTISDGMGWLDWSCTYLSDFLAANGGRCWGLPLSNVIARACTNLAQGGKQLSITTFSSSLDIPWCHSSAFLCSRSSSTCSCRLAQLLQQWVCTSRMRRLVIQFRLWLRL